MQHNNTKQDETLKLACELLDEIGLSGATLQSFLKNSTEGVFTVEYVKDETVFSRAHYHKALGVICSGELSSRKKIAGGDFALRRLQKGDIFGVAGLFGNEGNYVSDIIAISNATVVYFSEDFLEKIFHEYPDFAILYIKMISKKIRYLNAKLDGFATPNAYSKLAFFLYENNGYRGSMTALADQLDMSRMTLYRNIDLLVEERSIEKIGKTINVINPDLARIFDSSDEIL